MAKPKQAGRAGHGTKYAYNEGCRCDACTKANSARKWAEKRVGHWDGHVEEAMREGVAFVDNDVTIPADVIAAAIRNYDRRIKTEALVLYRMKGISR